MRASAKTLSTELANCQLKSEKTEKRHYQTVAINL